MNLSRFIIRLSIFLFLPGLAAILTYGYLSSVFLEPLNSSNTNVVLVEIAPGKTFKDICLELESKNLLKHWWSLSLLSRFGHKDTKIKAGEYELTPSMRPKEILDKLLSGQIFKRSVLVREGVSIWEIGKIVEDAGLMGASEFNLALADRNLLSTAGIKAESFEGYLFPETYYFSRPVTPKDIIWRMMEEGDKHWPPAFTERANELNLSRQEILTLASIIEKESGNADEQPIVSSVFHNRLGQGMRLQSDPTVIYGIKDFNGNITKDDLLNPHPYNTYVNFGLPPGPICNPGDTAIRAALYPKETAFLFFVGNKEGGHVFSTTLQEHNEAVTKYQLSRNAPVAQPTIIIPSNSDILAPSTGTVAIKKKKESPPPVAPPVVAPPAATPPVAAAPVVAPSIAAPAEVTAPN